MSEWLVIDKDRDNEVPAESRQDAEDKKQTALEMGSENVEIVPPGETDGGPEVIDAEPVEVDEQAEQLIERSVSDDPISWLERNAGDFVDYVGHDNTPAINRKGFEVLAHFYDVDVHCEVEVPPEDTGFEYCRAKAVATTADGRECEAYGSAHVDRDDDKTLLLEMADTRARKRALSIATGVGAVAVEELKAEATEGKL